MGSAGSYDVNSVDWVGLKADLTQLVRTRECAPILVRLSWHDAGTFCKAEAGKGHCLAGGAAGAQRFADGESQHGANAGLGIARDLLQPFKEKYPQVSYADLWALAAVVAIQECGGPVVPFRAGRSDIKSSSECVPEGRLPDGDKDASHVRSVFNRMGFDDAEIVALSGAHTLGRCHADRSGFEGPWTENPLKFDTSYFELLLKCQWRPAKASTGNPQMACDEHPGLMMLTTDHALVTDPALKIHTERFANDKEAFFTAFASAFSRLQENGHDSLKPVAI
mmetsp:Transcript_26956/g.56797  ORF Transcript_26956/g.56797 Transcript_26956/m.56797 type:complete len:280 (-) Transcript_26956:435-1274(-)